MIMIIMVDDSTHQMEPESLNLNLLNLLQLLQSVIKCSFIHFPRHRQMRMRSPCGSPIMKCITLYLVKEC